MIDPILGMFMVAASAVGVVVLAGILLWTYKALSLMWGFV